MHPSASTLTRMRSFDLNTPAQAIAKMNAALDAARRRLDVESVATADACDRVIAEDIASATALPEFRRSTVDGYALRSSSTPGVMRVVGEVRMGEAAGVYVNVGEAALVHTGGYVPEGADAVVMLEHTLPLDVNTTRIQTRSRLAPGENVIQAGEDVRAGEVVVRAGTRIREQELAGLLSLGMTRVSAVRRPRVALIASGDELVAPDQPTRLGQVRNTNAPMLAALIRRYGGEPLVYDPLPDRRLAFEIAAERAMKEADMVVFMAGSSVGERDFVPDVVNGMGKPGIIVHGILFRPGKPTLFAVADGKPVFGLPGNPISALVTASLFVAPTLWRIQGAEPPPQAMTTAVLTEDVKSPRDLEHWFPVRFTGDEGGTPRATPISTKSNLIFGLVRATGMVCAPIGVDRLAAGSEVQVRRA
jgi:molybdopterin molybdotransferase